MDEVVQDSSAVWSFVDRIAGRDEMVQAGVVVEFLQQLEKFLLAAVDVSDEDKASVAMRVVLASRYIALVQVVYLDCSMLEVTSSCSADSIWPSLSVQHEPALHLQIHQCRVYNPVQASGYQKSNSEQDGEQLCGAP